MKKFRPLFCILAAVGAFSQARAGSLSYVAIPVAGSDAGSGISPDNTYTSAVDGGNTTGVDFVVNGVTLTALVGSGAAGTAGNVTFTAPTGSLANAAGVNSNIAADGTLLSVLGSATFVHGADGDSTPAITLAPSSLTAGTTYDLRLYIGGWSGKNRMVSLSFSGDGQDPASTDFFNEDDATSSAGGFASQNQAYYIDYRFTWDGSTTPTISITQKDPHTPFHLYALTNQAVSAPNTSAPSSQGEAVSTAAPVSDDDVGSVSSDAFYTPLSSSGEWVSVSGYGNCWQPSGVSEDWRPYTNGYWAHTDCGWTWVSNEPWGWATDHYGRWAFIDGEGWVWVPGRVWAPAWVSWRYGGGSVGWAPLPPAARFDPGVGISIWADVSFGIGPSNYNFCAVGDLGSPNLATVIYPRERNVSFINNTTNITNIVYNNHNTTVYNGGPNLAAVNAAIAKGGGRPVPSLVLNRRQTLGAAAGGAFSQVQGNQLSLVAPRVIPKQKAAVVPKIAKTIQAPKIDRGWSGIKDPKLAAQLKAKVAKEAKGKTPQNTRAVLPAGVALAKPAVSPKTSAFFQKKAAPTPAATPAHAEEKPRHTPTPAPTPAVHHATPTPAATEKRPELEHFNPAPTPHPTPHPTPEHTPKPEEEHVNHTPTPKPAAIHTPTPKPNESQEEEKKKEEEKKAKEKASPTP